MVNKTKKSQPGLPSSEKPSSKWGSSISGLRILVTGGAGYKGVILVERLLELGHRVSILDNFMYGYGPVLHLVHNSRLQVSKNDVRNLKKRDLSGFDVIYHLAGISGVPACAANPHSAEMINVEATKTLVSLLDKHQLLINASTTSFYGATGKAFDENMPVEPISIYGKTKYEAERIVQMRPRSISLRFATVFGVSAKMRDDLLVNDFVQRAINDKLIVLFAAQSKRTFVHVQDAVSAYLFALDHQSEMVDQVFNVGDPTLNYSKQQIANAIAKRVPCEVTNSTMPSNDKRNFEVSFEKIRTLGYQTEYTLDDGISELIKLYHFYTINQQYRVI